MMRSTLLAFAAVAAALAAAPAALALPASSTITVTGEVDKACAIGQPTLVTLSLNDLTGPDGRISASLASSSVAASTEIENVWCNAPSTLSLDAAPMALLQPYLPLTPPGFTRLLTYDATLTGWPSPLVDRPLIGDAAKTATADEAHAGPNLVLSISSLEALNAAGTAPNTTAVLEAGTYSGQVIIGVTVQ
ncbi:MAG: hypothetical protein IT546_07985 [Caulobacteraceae bacterium]|nr:hypothetical protein [Caulobacteraceae bacterium]